MMKFVKPVMNREAVSILLRDELQVDFDALEEVGEGQIARTYSLNVNGRPCVLQFTEPTMSQGCLNESFFINVDALRFAAKTKNERFYRAVLDNLSVLDKVNESILPMDTA